MSTRKLIKGDRYRAGLWKLEDSCYEGHVRMPNAKFMIRTYRCTQGEAVAKFDSWVEAEGLDLAEDGAREACEGSIDDGMGTARRPLNREERRAMERRDRKAKRRQARKAASEADAARQSQDTGKEETEMQKVSKTDAQLPEPAAVPVQRPASPALAPVLRTISGETPHYRARFEVAAADGADAAEAVKEIVMGWLHAKGLDVPEGAADIAVPAGWTAADEPDAAKAVRFLGLSGAQGAAWAVEADELDGEFSRRR